MIKKWCLFLLLYTASLVSVEQEMLKSIDIERIMDQILSQHLGNKELSSKIVQHAVDIYINQFDPTHMYLLDSEVVPFTSLSDTQLAATIEQYKKGDFSLFQKLNQVIQNSILRSRKIRSEIESQEKDKLFGTFTINPKELNDDKFNAFAENEVDLKERMLLNLAVYIEIQKHRFGDSETVQKKDQVLKNYEQRLRSFENQYLYQDSQGKPLSTSEQQNLFSIHVLKALASSLDAHTSFYEAKEAYDMRIRLQKEFEGVGMGLKNSSNGIYVSRLIEGGPAQKSGLIQVGDILEEIDGKSIEGNTFNSVVDTMHGAKNTEVKLKFKRPATDGKQANEYEVTLKREEVILNTDRVDASAVPFGDGIIGKITLHAFYQGEDVSSEKDVRNAIEALEKKGNLKGLVLDLRDNTGGFLSQAVQVAGLFISNGVIVISKYSSGEKHFYRDVEGHEAFDGPLVILTSKTTASAAEIVAQALQDYGVALVVGDEHTYGKGTIQTQTVTDNQSSSYFKVTVGEYYTVSGKTPQKQGVKADIVVPSRWHDIQVGENDSVEPDTIPPSFNDNLSDVKPEEKAWYLKYYIPTLQQKTNVWRDTLPILQKNSEYRIANNKNYQLFLKGKTAQKEDEEPTLDEESEWLASGKQKTYGVDDLQMNEAVNIVEDMILLHRIANKKNP